MPEGKDEIIVSSPFFTLPINAPYSKMLVLSRMEKDKQNVITENMIDTNFLSGVVRGALCGATALLGNFSADCGPA